MLCIYALHLKSPWYRTHMKKPLKPWYAVGMAIVGAALVLTYMFQGGFASLVNIDLSSGDGYYFGQVLGQLLAGLIGVVLLCYSARIFKSNSTGYDNDIPRSRGVARVIVGTILAVVVLLIGGLVYGISSSGISYRNDLISGSARENLIKGSNETCIGGHADDPEVVSFCSCFSNKLADQLTNAEVASISNDKTIPPDVQKKIDAANATCSKTGQ